VRKRRPRQPEQRRFYNVLPPFSPYRRHKGHLNSVNSSPKREGGAPARGDDGGAGTDVEAQGRMGGKVRGAAVGDSKDKLSARWKNT
jgi:hypothetical protein